MSVAIQPIVNWPRSARCGQRYLVTVDVALAEPIEWPYDREEFIVGCVLEGGDAFTVEALGSTSMVLHRFGGTYGPVKFAVRAERNPAEGGSDMLRLTLVSEGGLPFRPIELPVMPEDGDPSRAVAAYAQWTMTTREHPPPARAATHHTIAGPGQQKRPAGQRTALLIGVNSDGLQGPENDVAAMEAALLPYGFRTLQLRGEDATREGILSAFESVIVNAGPDDAVFIFYSGHGGAFTVPKPDVSDQQYSPSHLLVPFIVPIDFHAARGFGGITSIEIAALLARLAAKTPNIVAAYDCNHGATPPRAVAGAQGGSSRSTGTSVLHLDVITHHVEGLQLAGVPVFGVGNPQVVQLYGCGPHENAYELPIDNERRMGAFSAALAGALEEAAELQVTWATLIEHVRRRLARHTGLDQRPIADGPVRRRLFSTVEADQETSLAIVAESPNRARILGAALFGIQPGDEFAVMPADAGGPDADTRIGDATVDEIVATEARARLDLRPPSTALPVGARAYRVKAVAPLLPVRMRLSQLGDEIVSAITASPLLRLAADGEPFEYELRRDDAGNLTIHDRIGPLSDPVPMTAPQPIVTNLERLARAAALRRLAQDSRWALPDEVTVEWGVVAGGRQAPIPLSGGMIHSGQRIYVRIRNNGAETAYVSLVDIGVAATVTVLSAAAPAGVRLDPGQEYVFGASGRGEVVGAECTWPHGLDTSRARTETIMILTSSEPLGVGVLEQSGVRSVARRYGSATPLEQFLAQAVTGSPRYAPHISEATARSSIRSIDFDLDPRPAPHEGGQSPGVTGISVRTADELRALCASFRAEPIRHTDEELVGRIEHAVREYRARFADRPEKLPSAPLDELLPLMGWLIYEASWEALQRISDGLDRLDAADKRRQESEQALRHVRRLADAARELPWPEFAPRALGAIRSQALAESKRDTEAGYDNAWMLNTEAMRRCQEYRDAPTRDVLGLDEMLLQLALAEIGTACRVAERVIGRWAEEFADTANPAESRARESRWVQRLFRDLTAALGVGELALDVAENIRRGHGFVNSVSEFRLTLHPAQKNAGIMASRAALLLLALLPEMVKLGQRPPTAFETWQAWEEELLKRITRAYRAVEGQAAAGDFDPAIRPHEQRQYVYIRLALGLLKPGYDLPARLGFAPCLALNPLDSAAVQALSEWLAADPNARGGRGVTAATMPSFIRSVVACRSQGPGDNGYQQWRRDWFELDAYAGEYGRRSRVEAALVAAESSAS